MLPEIGQYAMVLAFCLSIVLSIVPLAGASSGRMVFIRSAVTLAWGMFVMLSIAFGILIYSFVSHDFSVEYVAKHSSLALPIYYRVTAVWGGHEGSLLLWVWILAAWVVAVGMFSRNLPEAMVARVLAVLGMVALGFIGFMLFTSNPFDRLFPIPLDGSDLNPLLQDPGMIYHPPLLYMGYVGFAVSFAFAIAALLAGRLDAAWARWSRPWTAVSWAFLTCGIALGSWWAYYELGWGGWWFWDPVENASFMPWLTGTALLHSLAVTEKRGSFRSWTVMLAIITFGLTLLGAFLVRSGVITSVHAFATDPERGVYILTFFAISVGASLLLYTWRAPKIGLGGGFSPWSRETLLLANNVLLVVACAAVLLGTIYPLVVDAIGMGKISVGPPYFNSVFAPLILPLLLLIAIGPVVPWKRAKAMDSVKRLRWSFIAAILIGLAWPLAMSSWSPLVALSLFIAVWIGLSIAQDITGRILRSKQGLWTRITQMRAGYLGMHTAHLGIAVFIIGVAMVMGYEVERDVRLAPGDTVELAGYVFSFEQVVPRRGPNYSADRGTIQVSKDGGHIATLTPEKRLYDLSKNMPMTQASLDRGIFRDLYVSLGDPLDHGAWIVRVYYKPFMTWLWLGCILMALGGLMAAADRRYRIKTLRQRV